MGLSAGSGVGGGKLREPASFWKCKNGPGHEFAT